MKETLDFNELEKLDIPEGCTFGHDWIPYEGHLAMVYTFKGPHRSFSLGNLDNKHLLVISWTHGGRGFVITNLVSNTPPEKSPRLQDCLNYAAGKVFAQDAFPHMPAYFREFLISGLTDKEWDRLAAAWDEGTPLPEDEPPYIHPTPDEVQ